MRNTEKPLTYSNCRKMLERSEICEKNFGD